MVVGMSLYSQIREAYISGESQSIEVACFFPEYFIGMSNNYQVSEHESH